MFGKVTTEQQIAENPAWNQEFKLQQEANRIKEWKETKEFERYKFGKELEWKQKEYDQRYEIALLSALGKGKKTGLGSGTGPGNETPEQGDQPSDIDLEYLFDHDYDNTTEEFINQSDPFIWNNSGLGSNPQNQKFMEYWMSKGLNENQAIRKAIDELAKKAGMTPEEYRTSKANYAVTQYNTLSAEQKEKNPQLVTQYNAYKVARRNFDGMSSIKSQIDKLTNEDLSNVAQRADALSFIPKEATYPFNGKQVKLTKDDIYNMSLFALGRKTAFGFLVSDTIRQKSNAAKKRLEAKGLLDFANYVVDNMRDITQSLRSPVSAVLSDFRKFYNDPTGKNLASSFVPTMQVKQLMDMMEKTDLEGTSKKRAEIIKNAYGIKPNLKVGIMTGDNETDLGTLANIKRFAGAYSAGQRQNYSGDFSEFASSLNDDPKKNNLEASIALDGNNNPVVEIVSYNSNGDRAGGMTIQPDEAAKLNIDINSLYEPKEISILRNKINFNHGKTSAGDPSEKSTYVQGDVYFEKNDFPALMKSKFDVKGNVIYDKGLGLYFPYIYISDGKTSKVRMLPGDPSLQGALYNMRDVDPTLANKILTEK